MAAFVAYTGLGVTLLWSRVIGLDRSFWHDEILTVTLFLRPGPEEILVGEYIPNNHVVYSLLAWVTTNVVGESEVALRLLSVIPFLAGAALVTGWLHARRGALTAVLYLLFVTCSALLLDLSRQARGYGLAFLAMSVLVVSAFEARRTHDTRAVLAFFMAGLVGTLTLPIFGIAFVTTGLVLLRTPALRRTVAFGLVGSVLSSAIWYAPSVADLLEHSQQEFGARIGLFGILIAPFDHVLIPGLLWIEGAEITGSAVRILLVAFFAFVLLASPLVRDNSAGLLLAGGVVTTLLVVWAGRMYISPRFVSFLLVPLFVLLASGTARLLRGKDGRPGLGALVGLAVVVLAVDAFVTAAGSVARLPREDHRDAVEFIQSRSGRGTPLLAYTPRPADLDYYLGRPVRRLYATEVASVVCGQSRPVAYVTQPLGVTPVEIPCLERPGVEHRRFEQYSQGERIDVWLLPAAP